MKLYLRYIIFIPLVWIVNSVYGQKIDSLIQASEIITLQQVIDALDKHPVLLGFDERINSTNAYAESAKSLDPPKLSAGLWMFPYSSPKNSMDGSSGNQGALMIGVEQMIMNPAKRKAEVNYMKGMSSVEETMKEYDRQGMIEDAKKMYYEWIILKKKLAVLEDSEDLMNLMIESGEIGYTYNQNKLSRIYKAKSELYTIQNMQIMIENDIRQMNIELNTMMNIDKSTVFDIDTNYVISNYDLGSVDTSSIQLNRSDIENIQESMNLLNYKRKLELTKRNPDFGIQYGHMNSFGDMPNQFNLMGMITVPIAPWAAKGYKANLEGIKYETRSLEWKKKAILNEIVGSLGKLKTEIGNKKRQIRMYEDNLIPALQKNFSTSLIDFEHMKEDMFMTIDAWMALKMAKIEYLDLLGDVLKLQARYEREMEMD